MPSRRVLLLLALAGPAALVVAAFALRTGGGTSFNDLTREWSSAWKMIGDHFWLGVGPGNYGRYYPQYMAADAPTFARQPDSFVLEVWATLGLLALLGLGVALVSFFRRTLRLVPVAGEQPDGDQRTRWEFYEGAMVGLVIAFLLRAMPAGLNAIVPEAVDAVVRAVVWFAVFALIQGIRWSGATRVLACTAGVAALLLHLAISGGFFVPGLSQPLFILAALALNGLPEQPNTIGRQFLGRVVPLALTTAAALMFAMQIYFPVTAASADDQSALISGQKYLDMRSRVMRPGEELRPADKVIAAIIHELRQAKDADSANSRYWADLADWYGMLYEVTSDDKWRMLGIQYALGAQDRDPLGEAGYLAESRLHQIGAAHASDFQMRQEEAARAKDPLLRLLHYRKYDAQLHYRLAVVLIGSGSTADGKVHAADALKLDKAAPTPQRRLTDAQRQQAERFAANP
jgi:hypothetical protein